MSEEGESHLTHRRIDDKPKPTTVWHSIDQWAALLLEWVKERGKMDTVLTVWEIQNGEDSVDQGILRHFFSVCESLY